jgi:peptide deformylase
MHLTRRVLHLPAKPVDFRYPQRNLDLANSMFEFMHNNGGIGLAATQVGLRLRLFVVHVDSWRRACFNPEILGFLPEIREFDEGCLSFPGDSCIINRPDVIDVRYQDYQGNWHSERFAGLISRCFQHELDHLDGITMWDRYKEQHAEQS